MAAPPPNVVLFHAQQERLAKDPMFSGPFGAIWFTTLVLARAQPHGKLNDLVRVDLIRFLTSAMTLFPCPTRAQAALHYMNTNPMKAETGQQAFEYVVGLYNAVMLSQNQSVRTPEEVDRIMNARVDVEARDLKKRKDQSSAAKDAITNVFLREDTYTVHHAKIMELQKERDRLMNVNAAISNDTMQWYVMVAIIIAAVTLVLVLLFGALVLCKLRSAPSDVHRYAVKTQV